MMCEHKDKTKTTGRVQLNVISKDGEVIETYEYDNLIVDTGFSLIANRLGGVSANPAEYLAIGSDATAPASSDTSLGAELDRGQATVSLTTTNVTDDTLRLENTFTASSSITIREAGIFNAASGGELLARVLTGTVELDDGQSLQITYAVTIQ